MNVIEKHIHEHFARLAENGGADETIVNSGLEDREAPLSSASVRAPQASGPAFAKVNSVVAGSPAESAGLKAGDLIRNFGYVNIGNHENLRRVAECVQGNEGVGLLAVLVGQYADLLQQNVLVKVSRSAPGGQSRQELQLTLIPRRDWGGRGLLGCHILPL
jgi:26S proteasome non-ATPase regulatory subunit 9